jgi:hypothetical protein
MRLFTVGTYPKSQFPLKKELLKVGIPFKLATLAFLETGTVQPFFYLLYLLEEDLFFK